MKKYALLFAMLLALASSLVLTGCGASKASAQPVAVAIVIGNHACSRELNLSSEKVRSLITEAVETEGFVSVVNADGEPNVVAELSFRLDDRYRHADPTRLAQVAENKLTSLLLELTQVRADSPELDTLRAISLAARTLDDAPEGARKHILVLDTGLSTTGLLSFGNNLLCAEPAVIADMLEALEAIPDMDGVQLTWQQLGDVAAPQEELTPRQLNSLEGIWREIVERGGGRFEKSGAVPNAGAAEGLPEVTALTLPKDTPLSFEPSDDALSFREPVFLRENQVRFVGDSAAFLDKAQAEEVLRPIADYMVSHGDVTLLLIGTTAGDENSLYRMELSEARANTVRDTLVKMGVDAERLVTKGMGSGDPWHIGGVGTDGALASQNRKVVLLDAASDAARQLFGSDGR